MSILHTVIKVLCIPFGLYCFSDLKFVFPEDMSGTCRIMGGKIVSPRNLYPFQTLLYINSRTKKDKCGGSLIKPNWILTAAHCMRSDVEKIDVYLGLHDVSKKDEKQVQHFKTRIFVLHPLWNEKELTNDLALVKLPRYAKLNKDVNIITPVSGNDTFTSEIAVAIGWGRTELGVGSNQLKSVNVRIISNEECIAVFPKSDIIYKGHLCTTGEGEDLSGPCKGDSGGPLIMGKHLIGVISFGICSPGYPCVYTRLTEYSTWINDRMARGLNTSPNLKFNNVLAILTLLLILFNQLVKK